MSVDAMLTTSAYVETPSNPLPLYADILYGWLLVIHHWL